MKIYFFIVFSIAFLLMLFGSGLMHVHAENNKKLDIAFVPSGYSDLSVFQNHASRLQQYLLTLEPFFLRPQDLQFHTLNKIFDLNCKNIIDLQNPLISLDVCRDPSTIKQELKNANIPFDKIVILGNTILGGHADRDGGLAFVPTQTIDSEKTFAHEFAHLLGLFDEYVPSGHPTINQLVMKGKTSVANCSSSSTCDDWKGLSAECVPGCSQKEWYRSSTNSLMNEMSIASSFNLVSQRHLNKRIDEYVKDSTPPVVSILKPKEGEAFHGGFGTPDKGIVDTLFEIQVSAIDESFVSRIDLMIDNTLIKTLEPGRGNLEAWPTSYFTFFWDSGQSKFGSSHTATAIAYDLAGNSATSKTASFTIESGLEYLRKFPMPAEEPKKETIPEWKPEPVKPLEPPPPPKLTEEQLKKFEEDLKKMIEPPPPPPWVTKREIPPQPEPGPGQSTFPPPPGVKNLFIHYHYTTEGNYFDVIIQGKTMTYTSTDFEKIEEKCSDWIAQAPCWSENDLVTRSAQLKQRDINILKSLIQKTKIKKLKKYYGPPPGERCYSYSLTIDDKEITYCSGALGPKRPKAFAQIIEKIEKLVGQKF